MNKRFVLGLAASVAVAVCAVPAARADVMTGPCELANEGDPCTTLMNEDGTCETVNGMLDCVPNTTSGQGGGGVGGSGGGTTSGSGGAATSGSGGSTGSGGDGEDEGGCSVGALGRAGGGQAALLLALTGLGLTLRRRRR
jgi:hypothetical protein